MILKDIEGFVPTWKTSDHHPKETDGYEEGFDDGVLFVMEMLDKAPTVDAVEVDTLKAWLYEIAMNNTGNYLRDACGVIISRLDGLRTFARERKEASE